MGWVSSYSPVLRDEEERINKKENNEEKNNMMTKQNKKSGDSVNQSLDLEQVAE